MYTMRMNLRTTFVSTLLVEQSANNMSVVFNSIPDAILLISEQNPVATNHLVNLDDDLKIDDVGGV